jgi:hypothetical protein
MIARALAAVLAAAVVFLGVHLVLAVAAVAVMAVVVLLLALIFRVTAQTGWRTVPCKREAIA